MRDARYVRLISWTLQCGSEQYILSLVLFYVPPQHNVFINTLIWSYPHKWDVYIHTICSLILPVPWAVSFHPLVWITVYSHNRLSTITHLSDPTNTMSCQHSHTSLVLSTNWYVYIHTLGCLPRLLGPTDPTWMQSWSNVITANRNFTGGSVPTETEAVAWSRAPVTGLQIKARQGEVGGRSRARPTCWGGKRSVGIQQRWRKHDEGQRGIYSGCDAGGSAADSVRILLIQNCYWVMRKQIFVLCCVIV